MSELEQELQKARADYGLKALALHETEKQLTELRSLIRRCHEAIAGNAESNGVLPDDIRRLRQRAEDAEKQLAAAREEAEQCDEYREQVKFLGASHLELQRQVEAAQRVIERLEKLARYWGAFVFSSSHVDEAINKAKEPTP